MKGKRVPVRGHGVEVNIIDEDLTRLLLFEQGGLDFVQLRGEIATRLLAERQAQAEYAARGITRTVIAEPFLFSLYFNMQGSGDRRHDQRADRAAARDRLRLGRRHADPDRARGTGDPGEPDGAARRGRARSRAAGEIAVRPRHGEGAARSLRLRQARRRTAFARRPTATRLTLTLSLRTGGVMREVQTLWKKNMEAIGLRTEFNVAPFQEIIKDLEKGKFQMYQGGFGGSPSGYNEHCAAARQAAAAGQHRAVRERRLRPRRRSSSCAPPSDEEQVAAARTMNDIARTYMPLLPVYFRLRATTSSRGSRASGPACSQSYWKYLDIDLARRK